MMRANEVIAKADELKPNRFSNDTKLKWLEELEGRIYEQVVRGCEDAPPYVTPPEELTAGSTYREMYIYWLCAKIDLYNKETVSYNNYRALFNEIYDSFASAYRRQHMPRQVAALGRDI